MCPAAHWISLVSNPMQTVWTPAFMLARLAHRDELRGDDLHGAEVEGDHVHVTGDLLDRAHDIQGGTGLLRVELLLQLDKLLMFPAISSPEMNKTMVGGGGKRAGGQYRPCQQKYRSR